MFSFVRDAWNATTPAAYEQRQLVRLVETQPGQETVPIASDFASFTQRGFLDNGVIFGAVVNRLTLFSQFEYRIRRLADDETRNLPPRMAWLNAKTVDNTRTKRAAQIEQHRSLAGNYYVNLASPGRMQILRPDWVDIILAGGSEKAGYLYHEGGRYSGRSPRVLTLEEVAHGWPIPDPMNPFRGVSWISSVVREVLADNHMTAHINKFFEKAATPNLLIKVDSTLSEQQREFFRSQLDSKFSGWQNAFKTMVLEEGADAQVIGSKLNELAFVETQAMIENRISVASGVPSIVLGIKEGSEQATYSNWPAAVQQFGNNMQHDWNDHAETMETIARPPEGWELFCDTSKAPMLQTDQRDDAEIDDIKAGTLQSLIDSGFTPESAKDAVVTGDFSVLEHTGLASQQLQSGDVSDNGDGSDSVGISEEDDEDPDRGSQEWLSALLSR